MWGRAFVLAAAVTMTGCGEKPRPATAPSPPPRASTPETAVRDCAGGFSFVDDRNFQRGWRRRSVVAGPIAVLGMGGHANGDFDRRRAVYVKAWLAPRRTTTLAVAPRDRPHVSLSSVISGGPYTDAEGDAAITFEGCPPRVDDTRKDEDQGTGYAFAVIVDGPRCATFEITPEGGRTMRRRVPFGKPCP